jgi:hypothetical protein
VCWRIWRGLALLRYDGAPCSASSSCTSHSEANWHLMFDMHALQANQGKISLARCTLRKCAASPPGYMACDRWGAVMLNGPAAVTLQHCYVEVGMVCV